MATPQETEQQRRAAALAAGGALAVAAASGTEEQQPSPARRASVAGAILSALVGWLTQQRERSAVWLRERLGARGASSDAVEQVIAEEQRREDVFAERQAARIARDLQTALALPSKAGREQAVRALMAREERYVRQRAEAQAARAIATIDRVVLRGESPTGAFWRLDPTVTEHTAGCLMMGGKFWPWAVLDRVHPPRHAGCPCRLISYGAAISEGLLSPGDVMDVRTAVGRAAGVVMEAQMYRAGMEDAGMLRDLLFEGHLIGVEDTLIESGVTVLTRESLSARPTVTLGLGEMQCGAGLGRDEQGYFAYGVAARTPSFARREEITEMVAEGVVG